MEEVGRAREKGQTERSGGRGLVYRTSRDLVVMRCWVSISLCNILCMLRRCLPGIYFSGFQNQKEIVKAFCLSDVSSVYVVLTLLKYRAS